jgi:hypothetical protein
MPRLGHHRALLYLLVPRRSAACYGFDRVCLRAFDVFDLAFSQD